MPVGTLTTLRRDVAFACYILADEGQDDTVFGHASARDPAGRGLEEVRPSDLLLVGLDGTVLVYRARPEVQAVVHTHPPHATAFAALRVPLRSVSHEACLFVPPDVPRFTETTDLILTEALGGAVVRALGPGWALLLESHGIVTAGDRAGDACIRALLLEKAARIQLLAAGREATWISEAEAVRKREHLHSVWSYLVRRRERRRR